MRFANIVKHFSILIRIFLISLCSIIRSVYNIINTKHFVTGLNIPYQFQGIRGVLTGTKLQSGREH